VMVYFGETQVFEREMAEAGYGFVGGKFLGTDFLEKAGESGGVHADGYCRRGRRLRFYCGGSEVRLQT
jgi:hypothetical protein